MTDKEQNERITKCEELVKKVMQSNTIYSLFVFIISRLHSRYDPETLAFLAKHTNGNPLYNINDGARGQKTLMTAQNIRNMIRTWKAKQDFISKPFTNAELEDLEKRCNDVIEENKEINNIQTGVPDLTKGVISRNQDFWGKVNNTIHYKLGNTMLPTLAGCLVNRRTGQKSLRPFLTDTGASLSLLSLDTLKALDIHVNELRQDVKFRITTACGQTRCLGYRDFIVFLSDVKGRIYSVQVTFAVIDSPNLPRDIIGLDCLTALGYAMQYKNGDHTITLSVISEQGKLVRRIFNLDNPLASFTLKNKETITPGLNQVSFECDSLPVYEGNMPRTLYCNNSQVSVTPPKCFEAPEKYYAMKTDSDGNPVQLKYEIKLDVFNSSAEEISPKVVQIRCEPTDTVRQNLSAQLFSEEDVQAMAMEMDHMAEDGSEEIILDDAENMASYEPAVVEATPDEIKMPKLDHLSPKWQEDYKSLFTKFRSCLSQHTGDIGRITAVEPLRVVERPDAVWVPQKQRRYSHAEEQIIDAKVATLLETGIIKCVPNGSIDPCYFHALHLVIKHDKQSKIDRSQASTLSRRDSITPDTKCRLTHDLRAVNKNTCPSQNIPLSLPDITTILPLCRNFISGIDLVSGFHHLPVADDSIKYFSFLWRNKTYCMLRTPMGFISSCFSFSGAVHAVFNETDYVAYQKKYPELRHRPYRDTISQYLDDLTLHASSEREMFLLIQFMLEQSLRYNVKWNADKTEIMCKGGCEVLGFKLDPMTRSYRLSEARAQLILTWPMILTPKQARSRLSAYQYFSLVLPGIRLITPLLTLFSTFSDEEDFNINEAMIMEFLATKLLVACGLQFMIIDTKRNLIMSSDASYTSHSGAVFHYGEPPKMLGPTGPTVIPTREKGTVLACVGAHSRTFSKQFWVRSTILKELLSGIKSIQVYEKWIRACPRTIWFSDAISLTYLSSLKSSSSKMQTMSIYLSSFPNLFVYHTRGNHMLTTLTDILTRSTMFKMISPATVPEHHLEALAFKGTENLPEGFVIKPKLLHDIVTRQISDKFLSKVPFRKRTIFTNTPVLTTPEDLDQPLPEKEVLDVILGHKDSESRYKAILPTSKAFRNEVTGKVVSFSDFKNIEKKYKFDEIAASLSHIIGHIEPTRRLKTLEGSGYDDLKFENLDSEEENVPYHAIIQDFVLFVKQFLETKDQKQSLLYDAIQAFILDPCASRLNTLITRFMSSPLYNTVSPFRYELCSFILVENHNQDLLFSIKNKRLQLTTAINRTVKSQQVITIELNFQLSTEMSPEVVSVIEGTYFGCEMQTSGVMTTIFCCLLYNNTDEDMVLTRGQPFAEIILHGNPSCSCGVEHFCYILTNEYLEQQVEPLVYLNMISSTLMEKSLIPPYQEVEKLNGRTALALPVYKTVISKEEDFQLSKDDYNTLILVNTLLNNDKTFSPELIIELQNLCKHLVDIRRKCQKDQIQNFVLKRNILFKVERKGTFTTHLLCLDQNTTKQLIQNHHNRGHHFNYKLNYIHFAKFLYCKDMKAISKSVSLTCLVCMFGQASRQQKYIYNDETGRQPLKLWQSISADMIQSLPADVHRYKFLLVMVCDLSGYLVAVPTKTLTSEEVAREAEKIFGYLGQPEYLRSDFGSPFKAHFRVMCRKLGITMTKQCPTRSEANGRAEVSIRDFRNFLELFLISLGVKNGRTRWSDYIPLALQIYNSSVLYYSSGGTESKSRNFFGYSRFLSPRMIMAAPESEQMEQLRQASLKFNESVRERRRMKYKDPLSEQFFPGMLAMRVLSKADLDTVNGGKSLPNSRIGAICRILETLPGSVRVLDISTGQKRTLQYNVLKPINMNSSGLHCLPLSPVLQDHFTQGLINWRDKDGPFFQPTEDSQEFARRQVEEHLEKDETFLEQERSKLDEAVEKDLSLEEDKIGLMDLDEDGQTVLPQTADVPPAAPVEDEEGALSLGTDKGLDEIAPQPRYKLRTRSARQMEIKRKAVTFKNQVTETTVGSGKRMSKTKTKPIQFNKKKKTSGPRRQMINFVYYQ